MPLSVKSMWQMRRHTFILLAVILAGSFALLGVGMRLLVRMVRTPTYRLHMLSDSVPNRQILARRFVAEAGRHQLLIDLTSRSFPSLEGMRLVNDGTEINVALVPGGVGGPDRFPNVRQVAALGTDPLHVMVRPELYAAASRSLNALRGKRLNCGPQESVLRILAQDILRFAGLEAPRPGSSGDYRDESITSQDLLATLERARAMPAADRERVIAALPDAILFLSPLPSLLAKRLVATAAYQMVPLPFTEAYALDRLNLDDALGDKPDHDRVDRASIVSTRVPPDLYGTDPPVPPEACLTLGTRLLLIVHAKTDPEAVAGLLHVLYESPFTGLIQPPPLHEQVPQFELHPGTELYVRRRQPFLTPELLSQLGKLLGGLGAFASGLVGLYGFLRILQLRRFEAYYQELRRIVQVARGHEDDPNAPTDPAARRAFLLDQLDDLKNEAGRDFAEGGLKGEGLLAGVIALVNDTRNSLVAVERAQRYVSAPIADEPIDE
jgi:hypothetical protein